jgi:hypothetical protein
MGGSPLPLAHAPDRSWCRNDTPLSEKHSAQGALIFRHLPENSLSTQAFNEVMNSVMQVPAALPGPAVAGAWEARLT